MKRVAVIGCGVVGSSWALVFARAGYEVGIYDASAEARAQTLAVIRDALTDLSGAGLAGKDPVGATLARVKICDSIAEALDGAFYVQESTPERIGIKRELFSQLDATAAPDVILASSTSGLPASSFTEGLQHARRCLVAHPINPPHLIPLVEIVPAPWTDPRSWP